MGFFCCWLVGFFGGGFWFFWYLLCLVFSEFLGSFVWCLSLILENFWLLYLQIFLTCFSFFSFWCSNYAFIVGSQALGHFAVLYSLCFLFVFYF